MKDTNKLLFSDFKPATKQEWIERANIDLKGQDFNRKLVWKNLSKIEIQPFYTLEDTHEYLNHTGENSQSLINYRKIITVSAGSGNALALKAVEEGVNGLLFDVKNSVSATKLLEGINLDKIAVSFILNEDEVVFALDFFAFAEENLSNNLNLKGSFDLQLIPNYVTKGTIDNSRFEKAARLVKMSVAYPNFKAVTLSGTAYLDSGANQVQEVAYTLNSLVFLLDKYTENGIGIQSFFNNLNVILAIGSEYFVEIAKFRAFNSLLESVAKKYGVTKHLDMLTAKTSIWSKSVIDANTNLLRATTEAMSAILGNVDGILIDPYDSEFNEASDFSSRIAGNITTILKEESYFGKVANPVDGSYYIEEVSAKIATNALALFKEIEVQGGFYQAFESEIIQQQIAEIRQEKIKLISQRRLPMVGVNKYPNLMETISKDILFSGSSGENSKFLKPRRASLEIEAIRNTTEAMVAKTKIRPIVELTSFGDLTMRKARAAFAYDLIGVSGFEVQQEKSFGSAKEAAEASVNSKSNVVVICSSDQDYDESALDFVKTFRALNNDKVLLLAGNPINIMAELTEAGLDGCIHLKSDVITIISNVQNKIQKLIKPLEV
jgi:methylmalonyl-CoA mutase